MPIYVFVMQALCLQCMLGPRASTLSALVKAELQFPSKADKQTTLTSAASNHAVQDTEEMTGPPKLPCTATEAPMRPVSSQTAPLQTRSGRIVEPPDRLNL